MTALLGRFTKQSTEVLDYDVDFTEWFSNRDDEPTTFAVVVQTGLTLETSMMNAAVVKVVLSGGTDGETYKVTVRMHTTASLVKEADFTVRIKDV